MLYQCAQTSVLRVDIRRMSLVVRLVIVKVGTYITHNYCFPNLKGGFGILKVLCTLLFTTDVFVNGKTIFEGGRWVMIFKNSVPY
mgnify:FL=1